MLSCSTFYQVCLKVFDVINYFYLNSIFRKALKTVSLWAKNSFFVKIVWHNDYSNVWLNSNAVVFAMKVRSKIKKTTKTAMPKITKPKYKLNEKNVSFLSLAIILVIFSLKLLEHRHVFEVILIFFLGLIIGSAGFFYYHELKASFNKSFVGSFFKKLFALEK